MFRLHDRTRRRLHLSLFVSCCLAPTLVMTGWGVWRHLPGRIEQESQRLARLLRLRVHLESVTYLRPGAVRYRGLELSDPETGAMVFRCPELEAAWRTTAGGGQEARSLVLTGGSAEVDASQRGSLIRLADDRLAAPDGPGPFEVRAAVREMVVSCGDGSFRVTDVRGRIGPSPEGAEAELRFRLAEEGPSEPIRFRLARHRHAERPTSSFHLTTGTAALPCQLFETAFPGCPSMGPKSTFTGRVGAGRGPDGWHGELAGRFAGVDLGQLVRGRIAHLVAARGEITIESATFSAGRIDRVSGSVSAGPGSVSRSLVDGAVQYLGLIRAQGRSQPGARVPFEQLALRFSWDTGGLRLRGQCTSPAGGVILADRLGPVLGDAGPEPIPLARLVQALLPPASPQVSATRQTAWLMRWLPLPDHGPLDPRELQTW